MAPVAVMEEHTWHVRGVPGTHLGPYNQPDPRNLGPYGRKTMCGLVMDLRYVEGMANGDRFDPDALCRRCVQWWWGS